MTATTVPSASVKGMRETVVSDPGTTKVALVCGVVALGEVIAGFAYLATHGGDIAALSVAIGAFLTASAGIVSKLVGRKSGSGTDG